MRFDIIAPLVQGTYTDVSIAAYCRRVYHPPFCLPDGRQFLYKPKTVGKWYNLYTNGGMDTLLPRPRCDKGGIAQKLYVNSKGLCKFRYNVMKSLHYWLNRRSQKKSYTWEGINEVLKRYPLATPGKYVSVYAG